MCRSHPGAAGNFGVDVVLPERAVGGEGGDRTVDLIEQGADLRAVTDVVGGQRRRDDPARVGIRADMELAPRPTRPAAMLLPEPLARPAQAQPRAVHQQMHRPGAGAGARLRHFQCLGPAAQGRMVRDGEVEAEQAEDGADQALGLAQGPGCCAG